MDMFSDRPVECTAVNIHEVLGHVKRIAETGFAAAVPIHEDSYDPLCRRCGATAICWCRSCSTW